MKNSIIGIKNTLEGIKKLDDTEEWVNELEDTVVEITDAEQKKRIKKIRTDWDIKCTNIKIIGVPEGGEKEAENIFEDNS